MCKDSRVKQSVITGSVSDFHYSCWSTDEEDMTLFSQYIIAVLTVAMFVYVCVCVYCTARFGEPSSVDLILHHICPVKEAVIKVEV